MCVVSLLMIVIIAPQIQIVNADTEIVLNEAIPSLEPAVFGNMTPVDPLQIEISDISVTEDGCIFIVAHCPSWRYCTGPTEVSLIAWGSDGTIMWSQITTHYDRIYFGVCNDENFVYVTGSWNHDILVEKYTFDGELVWNTTTDMGQIERGYEVQVMDDGTIIIGGASYEDELPYIGDYILLAMNQTGHTQWSYAFDRYPSPQCDSESLYITTGTTVQKWDSRSSVIWMNECIGEHFGCVKDRGGYTISSIQVVEHYDKFSLLYMNDITSSSELNITSWNVDTGEEKDSSSLRLCDSTHNLFNCVGVDTSVDQNGMLWIIMNAKERESWYLMSYNVTSESTSIYKVFDEQWCWVQLEMGPYGNAYLALFSDTYGYTVMRFDSNQILPSTTPIASSSTTSLTPTTFPAVELTDLQAIFAVAFGVAAFDLILILYLKRRVSE